MKKTLTVLLIALVALSTVLVSCSKKSAAPAAPAASTAAPAAQPTAPAKQEVVADKSYVIRIYSNTNDESEVAWFKEHAAAAGFIIDMDDNSVYSGDTAAVQAANEGKDADVVFGLNETRWGQIINGEYANLKLVEWTPSWANLVGGFKYDGKAYGMTIQDILMLYRTDALGTNGKAIKMDHWYQMAEQGYVFYRQGKVGGTTNGNINNCMLYPFTDPTSPAGGISVEGWKALWNYCAKGVHTGDSYGFDPLNRGEVQLSTFYSSSLYGSVDTADSGSKNPLTYDVAKKAPGNWALVEVADGSYYIAEYIGVIEKAGRTEAQTLQVKAFCDWLGSTATQIEYANQFDRYPCNTEAAKACDIVDYAGIYSLPNMAKNIVPGTNMEYNAYVAAHTAEWTNIMTNLGFFWKEGTHAEPDWNNLDWATLCKAK